MGLVLFAHTVSLHRQGAVPPFGWDLAVYLASKDRPWFCRSPGFVSFAPSRFRNGMNAKPISTFTVARLRRIHTGFPCSARGKAGHKTYSAVRQKKKPHGQTSASVTDCSHILPSFIPFQGRAPGSHTVGILARASAGNSASARTQPSQVSPMTGSLR